MNIEITNTTSFVLNELKKKTHGTVHSVYRKTINIVLGEKLLALQASNTPISPLSMITNLCEAHMDSLAVKQGMAVFIMHNEIRIILSKDEALTFSYLNSQITDTHFDISLTDFEADKTYSLISQTLKGHSLNGLAQLNDCGLSQLPTYLAAAKTVIRNSLKAYKRMDWEESAGLLVKLIGLGIGLTPSGDDFLCGVMAGLIMTGKSDHPFTACLSSLIRCHLSDTNDISSAFLECALMHHFGEAVHALKYAQDSDEIYEQFSKIGHSSGTDTLCGVCFSLMLPF